MFLKITTFGDQGSQYSCHASTKIQAQITRNHVKLCLAVCVCSARSPTGRLGTNIIDTPQACGPAILTSTVANNKIPCFKHGGIQESIE